METLASKECQEVPMWISGGKITDDVLMPRTNPVNLKMRPFPLQGQLEEGEELPVAR